MQTTLKLAGLHCGNCAKSVEKALLAVEGVTAVQVNLTPEQQAVVEGTATAETLAQAVEDIGFDVIKG